MQKIRNQRSSLFYFVLISGLSFFGGSQVVSAYIDGTEVRHQLLLKKTAMEACEISRAYSELVLKEKTPMPVDQGIRDYRFISELRLIDPVEKSEFRVQIISLYQDQYDHEAHDWGRWSIERVEPCRQVGWGFHR